MADPVGLRLQEGGRLKYYDSDGLDLINGDYVVVDDEFGRTIALVSEVNPYVPDELLPSGMTPVYGFATEHDWEAYDQKKIDEAEALKICREKVEAHRLEMHIERAFYTDDRSKLIFHFTAENRVDFRDLVRDLASVFHTRIELRQIGVREDAQFSGGIGICGRELCCATFLDRFDPVSIRMVKDQNISLNPSKISGHCGRLMCCLNYEHQTYLDAQKRMPRLGHTIRTPQGDGKVVEMDVLTERITVQLLDDHSDGRLTYEAEELGYGKAREAKTDSDRGSCCGGECPHDASDKSPEAKERTRPRRGDRRRGE